MYEYVDAVPVLGDRFEQCVDLGIDTDIERVRQFRSEPGRKFVDTPFELVVLIREREFGAFARERLSNARCDGTIAGDADDQRSLAGHEAHSDSPVRLLLSF